MTLHLSPDLLSQIHSHGESTYPEEGAGVLLGYLDGTHKHASDLMELPNAREGTARRSRYLITPEEMLRIEQEAMNRDLEVLGVFHSHPDHPNRPSEFDREWALPWFSYLITSIETGKVSGSRSWLLLDDRSGFVEEPIILIRKPQQEEDKLTNN